MARSRSKRSKPSTVYVMFGFNVDDEDQVGYFGNDLDIVSNVDDAKRFPLKNTSRRKMNKDFGRPEQWLEFINSDSELNHGYKFHLVAVTA